MDPGSRLDGYELVRLLGAGGMGEVWLASDPRLGRKIAVKLLPAALTSDPARVARFEHEARAASSLNHPNVCTIHALGHTGDGQRYIAMELVDGPSLRERLALGPLPRAEMLSIAVQIARALTASHAAGVVHRDLKPENVMLRPDGIVKVVDFGLAKLTDVGNATSTTQMMAHTAAGSIVGTVMYMSPEQARGLPVDARTDIWSLGVMLFEMLEGRPPFHGNTATDILAAIIGREPALRESGSGTSQELRRIVGKALRKDREQRYQVMKDLELDLQALRDEREASALPEAIRSESGSRRRVLRLVAAASIVTAGAGSIWWLSVRRAPVVPAQPEVSGMSRAITRPLTRLTFDSGLQTDPAFSPDGRSIAYASDRSGNFDIWQQSLDGGEPRQITTSAAQETQPAWSPDGRSLVYRSEGGTGGLFTVAADGGPVRQVTSFGEHPIWLNDREILFVSGYGNASSHVFVVSSDGMDSPRALLEDIVRGETWLWMAPLADGRISLLGREKSGAYRFLTVSRDGKQLTTSAFSTDLPLMQGEWERFNWSTAGDALYVQSLEHGLTSLWKVYVDKSSLEWRHAERLTAGTDDDSALTITSDGSRIAYSSQRTATRIWTFPLDGERTPRLGKGSAISAEDGFAGNVTLSPDGRYAAYVLNRHGDKRLALAVTDLIAHKTDVLATNAFAPTWSRDGRRIAYVVQRAIKDQTLEFALVSRQIGGAEAMLKRWSDKSLFIPTGWSADDEILGSFMQPLYGRASLTTWSRPSEVPSRVLIDQPDFSVWQTTLSPNGRWLSFVIQPIDHSESLSLGIARFDGRPIANWTLPLGRDTVVDKPRWSKDGKTLFVLAKNGQPFLNVWAVRFDPDRGSPIGGLTQVSRFDSPRFAVETGDSNDIAVGAHEVALSITTASGSIWMMENVDK